MPTAFDTTADGIPFLRFWPDHDPSVPPILLIHENRGLSPYMLDVIELLVGEGFEGVAPDLLHRLGGTEAFVSDPEAVTTRQVPESVHEEDLVALFDRMSDRPQVLGFCFGAEMGWRLATRRTPLRAALLYGIGPEHPESIGCPVFAAYAEDDDRVNRTVPALCDRLAGAPVDFRLVSYPGTRHAFHDHRRPERHHARAATHLWQEVVGFLRGM